MRGQRHLLLWALGLSLLPSVAWADAEIEGCPPWCPVPHEPTTTVSPHAKGRWWPGFAMRSYSLRVSDERSRIGTDDRTAGSVGLEERSLNYLSLGKWSARYTDFIAFGGGNAGVDGGAGMDGAIGFKPLVGPGHGPLLRLGVRAHWYYRAHFHTSILELPQAQVGYSFIGRRLHLEAAARGGPVLTGRYGVDGGAVTRLDNSLEVGGYVSFGLRPVRLDVEASRVRLGGVSGPVDSLDALLCGTLAKPIVCFHGSALRGTLGSRSGSQLGTATYVGVTIGYGPVEWR
ncbi:MAG TPA: hypothetical protein VH062_23525 [Polyangiaceae bacterium]|jgi:hypothetical protein|nr:hypothetical protein [Polyangiaceae bacterium]